MIFAERKIKKGYKYNLEDIFGTVEIESEIKLVADQLDEIICILLRQNVSAKILQGEVRVVDSIIKYKFVRTPNWEKDEETTCENIPISQEQENVSIREHLLKNKIVRWYLRFVEAFLEAWKKTK